MHNTPLESVGERRGNSKLRYGPNRTRLKGTDRQQIWSEWTILAYNGDTLAIRSAA